MVRAGIGVAGTAVTLFGLAGITVLELQGRAFPPGVTGVMVAAAWLFGCLVPEPWNARRVSGTFIAVALMAASGLQLAGKAHIGSLETGLMMLILATLFFWPKPKPAEPRS